MSKIHELKTNTEYFEQTKKGIKPWEIRINDRDYQVGDIVILQEWDVDTKRYTHRVAHGKIIYMLDNFIGLADGYIAFSLGKVTKEDYEKIAGE